MISGIPAFSILSTEEPTREKATLFIQRHWRGYAVRKKFSKPKNIQSPVDEQVFPIGNDPISHLEAKVMINKHPAILATGGAQCLSNAIRLTQLNGNPGKKPKIFIMDHSKRIIDFWKLLSRALGDSKNIHDFLAKLPRHMGMGFNPLTKICEGYIAKYPSSDNEKNISQWIPQTGPYKYQKSVSKVIWPELEVEELHPRQHYEFFENLFGYDEERFSWVKNLVTNQVYLLQNCWIHSPESFKFIRNVCDYHGYDIFVYASNIEDFNPDYSTDLWRNISKLSPSMVIKTNTKFSVDGTGYPISTDYIPGSDLSAKTGG